MKTAWPVSLLSSSRWPQQTVFNLSPSTEGIFPDILKHVTHFSDIKKTRKILYLYRYRLAKVLQYHEDLSYPHFLLQNLNELNGTMYRTFDLIAALSIKFQKPPKPEEFNDGDHVKKIYGWCVLYRIKNILEEGNPIVQSLSMTDVCHKLNHQRVPTHLSTCC